MITLTLAIPNLNISVQVGDLIYATSLAQQSGANEQENNNVGSSNLVGVLRRITQVAGSTVLDVDDSGFIDNDGLYVEFTETVEPTPGSFIMFSKWRQGDSGVLGYYADVKLVNNSTDKAEIFSIGSEVIINSK